MATNVTAEFHSPLPSNVGGQSSKTTVANISKADITVNTTPNSTGGWNTAVVTADKVRNIVFTAADGVPAGNYEAVGGGTYRKQ